MCLDKKGKKKMNLLEETKEELTLIGKTPADIEFKGLSEEKKDERIR